MITKHKNIMNQRTSQSVGKSKIYFKKVLLHQNLCFRKVLLHQNYTSGKCCTTLFSRKALLHQRKTLCYEIGIRAAFCYAVQDDFFRYKYIGKILLKLHSDMHPCSRSLGKEKHSTATEVKISAFVERERPMPWHHFCVCSLYTKAKTVEKNHG